VDARPTPCFDLELVCGVPDLQGADSDCEASVDVAASHEVAVVPEQERIAAKDGVVGATEAEAFGVTAAVADPLRRAPAPPCRPALRTLPP
jgi:hypothetical protein